MQQTHLKKDIEKKNAIGFYQKNGFKKLASQEDYYGPKISTSLFAKRINK
jgi:ribosomal protein S18 acetylase RimI-like enzyme